MSPYRHVADKNDLLDAMGEAVLAEMVIPELDELWWGQALEALAGQCGCVSGSS